MRLAIRTLSPLIFSLVLVAPALAAPAPFPRSSQQSDVPVSQERLKQHLLATYGFHADHIAAGEKPNEWYVIGNTPMMAEGNLMYMQGRYRVTVKVTDRRGNPRTELEALPMRRMVITR